MKFYWLSNAPHVGTGYGNQTDLFTRMMREDGHEVIIRAFFGLQHAPMRDSLGRLILPGSYHGYGDDIVVADYKAHQPDAGVVLCDAWVYSDETLKNTPLAYYAPIDHTPAPPEVSKKLKLAKTVWAMSRHGEREMRQAMLDPYYVPHGVDTDIFKPIDRKQAREKLQLPDKAFFAVSVAANKGFPDRKNIRAMMKAWATFAQTHDDAIFYLHTNPNTTNGGLDIDEIRQFYGIPRDNFRMTDVYKLINGMYTPELLNILYNAADVFVLPSMGEGFGIPVIEAQAAGCPVIVSDFSAQAELCGAGWKCEINPLDDLEYTPQDAEQCRVKPSVILENLEKAYRDGGKLRDKARDFAMKYDIRNVWEKWALPALKASA